MKRIRLTFGQRLRLARLAFQLKPFEVVVQPAHIIEKLREGAGCDTTGCANPGKYCVSVTKAELKIGESGHYHLCEECTREEVGE